MDGDLLKTITNYDFNVDHSNPQDRKIKNEYGKKFNIKQKGRKNPRDEFLIRLFKSPDIMAVGISTIFVPENPKDLSDRINISLQEEQAGNNSDVINEDMVAILDKLLEYKCISKKQHKIFCLNVQTKSKI